MTATNRLAAETSPYLRQHAENPVDWYAWGPAAFAAAKERDVPILLSVGYSACHWCHVMAHESFEDDEVADVMNRLFVNVKVDREERPDVDAVYMDAVQAMTGRGGWPMTVFLAPDGNPFYGGTYFPKPQFLQLLAAIDDVWRNRRADLQQNVDALKKALDRTGKVEPAKELPGIEHLNLALQQFAQQFDADWGGFGSAPKFPSTMGLELVLRAQRESGGEQARQVVATSLDAMASGGMYDHLGGGFARYSVDAHWLVPHFEKMLYDQALLARIYLHAWQAFGEVRWKQVVEETIGYVMRDLRHPDGGFYSAEDADSLDEHGHSHEGLFYVWTPVQIDEVLGPELGAVARDWYEVTPGGNFEGATILSRLGHRGELIRPDDVERARQLLFEARGSRRRPGLDDKVLTEWNGLMLATLAEAAAALGRADWLEAAIANAEFLLRELREPDGRWRRSWQADGGARHRALAADHAALVDAFTRLAEASGQARWIEEARAVADQMLDHFWDPQRGGLFTVAEDGEQLVVRQKDLLDNATPSANSIAANALYRLGALTGEARYEHQADQILQLLGGVITGAPTAFANALAAVDMRRAGIAEVAIVGDRPDMVHAVQRAYRPNVVLAWGEPYESPLWASRTDGHAYVCRHYACQAPQTTVDGLLAQLA
ncbi:MAG: thioredoxin domain-containing protein [Acidimicrobiia bacterium]